ncbi:hypothetical protein RJ641_011172 [Dillenia turbinata]|uniref:Uncharacterized protein n=1 Tax=Dillenia turbinata TaxID=194707 RepID=A0AAN8UTC4_9MAGN
MQDFKRNQQSYKNYAKYATRQKRADTKKALKDLLLNYGASRASLQDENTTFRVKAEESWDDEESDFSDGCNKKYKAKSSSRRSKKAQFSRNKRKFMRENFGDDLDDHPETFFHATCGSRYYTWSFRSWEDSFRSSATGFEWKEHSQWTSGRNEDHESTSEAEDEICVGSCSDRKILGLPPTGPIKIEDVKNANNC